MRTCNCLDATINNLTFEADLTYAQPFLLMLTAAAQIIVAVAINLEK